MFELKRILCPTDLSENSRKAIQWIESLTREVEVGALYLGKVTRINNIAKRLSVKRLCGR